MSSLDSLAGEVVLKPRKALPFFSRHPWVFEGAIDRTSKHLVPGSAVTLRAHDGKFVAYGLWNPHSKIRVRLYSWDESAPLTDGFWTAAIDRAVSARQHLPEVRDAAPDQLAIRLINSEGDQLSGLTVDRFGHWLSVQFTSLALYERRELIVAALRQSTPSVRGGWLRTEKGIRKAEGLEVADGPLFGDSPPADLEVTEHGLRFGVDLVSGQKTGYFLDQRDNRQAAARLCHGRRVLDMFCYTGGFALQCAGPGGAREVTAIDASEPAIAMARRNAERNKLADRVDWRVADAFRALEELSAAGEQFDVVILDPPKLARTRGTVEAALRGYYSLNRLAMNVLAPGGLLVTCSCSGLVDRDEFLDAVARAALHAQRPLQLLEARGPALDHPRSVFCMESDYLKCFVCRVS